MDKDSAEATYLDIKTRLVLSKEKLAEMQVFKTYYDQIDPYKQVKLDLGQINEELALWIANMKKGVNAKNYHYQDIRVEQEQTVQETEQAIIKQIYDSQDIQNVYIKFDFSTIKSYGPQHPLQT
mmetsp:Transcript_3426/g.3379  ORF Transcript_3426/g.3379 Transcript_3426/m.3379 type:complete len:124 (+) Transcript_3426:771-1142(+)